MKKILLCLCCLMVAMTGFSKDTKNFKGKVVSFTYPSFLSVTTNNESDSLTTISLTSEDNSEIDVNIIVPSKGYTVSEYSNYFNTNTITYLFQRVGYGNFSMKRIGEAPTDSTGTQTERAMIGEKLASGYDFTSQFAGVPLYGKILTCKADSKHFVTISTCSKDSALLEKLQIVASTIKFEGLEQQEATPDASQTAKPEASLATTEPETPSDPSQKVFDVVEEMPTFPGGNSELIKFLSSNVVYPDSAYARGAQGKVVLSFVVEKDGSIGDVKVMKSVDPDLDQEAIRAVKSMPNWNPGKQNGEAVRVKYNVPISFKMPEEQKYPDERILNLVSSVTGNFETTALGQIVDNPETPASFPGDEEALNAYIAANLYYPPHLRNFGIEDTITLEFIVEKNGQISDIRVTEAHSETLAKQALKLVQEMPAWTPATDKKQPVRSMAKLQVEFKK